MRLPPACIPNLSRKDRCGDSDAAIPLPAVCSQLCRGAGARSARYGYRAAYHLSVSELRSRLVHQLFHSLCTPNTPCTSDTARQNVSPSAPFGTFLSRRPVLFRERHKESRVALLVTAAP